MEREKDKGKELKKEVVISRKESSQYPFGHPASTHDLDSEVDGINKKMS